MIVFKVSKSRFNQIVVFITVACISIWSSCCISSSFTNDMRVSVSKEIDNKYQYVIGNDLMSETDDAKAFERELESALKGSLYSEHVVGLMYFYGKGTKTNIPAAMRWLEKAAKKGDADSQNDLGSIYKNAIGVDRNCKMAIYWLEKAVKQKQPLSYYNMGDLHIDGMCMQPNGTQAVYWYMKAANKNNHNAQYKLGIMFKMGDGVLKNNAEANRYFVESCNGGVFDACAELKRLSYFH